MRDPHRPGHQPVQGIYDALVKFTPNRFQNLHRNPEDGWVQEREYVLEAATRLASQHGLRPPAMADVERAQTSASGHFDYMTTFTIELARSMRADIQQNREEH